MSYVMSCHDDVLADAPASNELWTFQSDGTITTRASSGGVLCLDSAHSDSTSLTANQLTVFTCTTNNVNQKWKWDTSTGIIENTGTGYCLDASINGITTNKQLALAPCNANILGQRFWNQVVMLPTSPLDESVPIYVYGTKLLFNACRCIS